MKKTIFLIVNLIIYINIFTQTIEIKTDYAKILYDTTLLQPIKINYVVKCNNKATNKFERDNILFYLDSNYKTSTNDDYKNNDYDRGHMTPAAAFNCDSDLLNKTFCYVNIALQHKDLNRKSWYYLEKQEKYLALKNKVLVQIDVIFKEKVKVRNDKSSATIPTHFKKKICLNDTTTANCKTYLFENKSVIEKDVNKFLINN